MNKPLGGTDHPSPPTQRSSLITDAQLAAIRRAEVVSFDLFDTLVVRSTWEPRDVFLIMERQLVDRFGQPFAGFGDERFASEVAEATATWATERFREYRLAQVYDRLAVGHPEYFGPISKDELIALELETERACCSRHPAFGQLYDEACDQDKTVLVVSDIYLPREHIEGVLADAGYTRHAHLFVSCAHGANKASGLLYEQIVRDLGVAPSQIVHFGDNLWSDVTQARAQGLNALLLPRGDDLLRAHGGPATQLDASRDVHRSLLLGLQKNSLLEESLYPSDADETVARELGYQMLGPLLYGFTRWLVDQAKARRLEALYFVSREGWFLKQVYDALAPTLGCDVPSHYLYASRRAVRFAAVRDPIGEGLSHMLVPGTLPEMLAAIDLEITPEECAAGGFSDPHEQIVEDTPRQADLARFLEQHADAARQRIETERDAYLAYLDEIGLSRFERVGTVDAGWYGTSQNALTKLLRSEGIQTRLTGMYLATHSKGAHLFSEDSEGLGFAYHQYAGGDWWLFSDVACVLEVLLSAPSASLRRFRMGESGPEPEFMGEPTPQPAAVLEVQRAALEFAQRFATAQPGLVPDLSASTATEILERFIRTPTPSQARLIGALPYDPQIFHDENDKTFHPPPRHERQSLRHAVQAVRDFAFVTWPLGYYHSRDSRRVRVAIRALYPSMVAPDSLQARGLRSARELRDRVKRKIERRIRR